MCGHSASFSPLSFISQESRLSIPPPNQSLSICVFVYVLDSITSWNLVCNRSSTPHIFNCLRCGQRCMKVFHSKTATFQHPMRTIRILEPNIILVYYLIPQIFSIETSLSVELWFDHRYIYLFYEKPSILFKNYFIFEFRGEGNLILG